MKRHNTKTVPDISLLIRICNLINQKIFDILILFTSISASSRTHLKCCVCQFGRDTQKFFYCFFLVSLHELYYLSSFLIFTIGDGWSRKQWIILGIIGRHVECFRGRKNHDNAFMSVVGIGIRGAHSKCVSGELSCSIRR